MRKIVKPRINILILPSTFKDEWNILVYSFSSIDTLLTI